MSRSFQEMNPVERLAEARGEAPPTIEISRARAEEIVKALAYAGQHHLAHTVREALQWPE